MYFDTLVYLRRITTSFIRSFVGIVYKLKVPSEFISVTSIPVPSQNTSNNKLEKAKRKTLSLNFNSKGKSGLKVVIFSRGSSGKGRSMRGEQLIVKAFKSAGALAAFCCDYEKTSLEDQLSYAYYADAVRIVHTVYSGISFSCIIAS